MTRTQGSYRDKHGIQHEGHEGFFMENRKAFEVPLGTRPGDIPGGSWREHMPALLDKTCKAGKRGWGEKGRARDRKLEELEDT